MIEFQDIIEKNYSSFGQQSKIVGEIFLEGRVHISGHIEGVIQAKEGTFITVESEAVIQGEINCYDIEILGKVKGKIFSKGKVFIRPSAEVSGEVQAETLKISPGAILNIEGHTF